MSGDTDRLRNGLAFGSRVSPILTSLLQHIGLGKTRVHLLVCAPSVEESNPLDDRHGMQTAHLLVADHSVHQIDQVEGILDVYCHDCKAAPGTYCPFSKRFMLMQKSHALTDPRVHQPPETAVLREIHAAISELVLCNNN